MSKPVPTEELLLLPYSSNLEYLTLESIDAGLTKFENELAIAEGLIYSMQKRLAEIGKEEMNERNAYIAQINRNIEAAETCITMIAELRIMKANKLNGQ